MEYDFAEDEQELQVIQVLSVLRRIRRTINVRDLSFSKLDEDFDVERDKDGNITSLTSAWVPLSSVNDGTKIRKIYLSPYSLKKYYSKKPIVSLIGILAHELSHLAAQTLDYVYGYNDCVTNLSPEQKVKNADNYAYYVEIFLHPLSRNYLNTVYFYPVSNKYRSFSLDPRTQSSRIEQAKLP